jgi:5-methylcytosine-specific restriction protein B
MPFDPESITKEHVAQAISLINRENIKLRHSTRWDVIIDGKTYPLKEVMRYAHQNMNGEFLWGYSGGEAANKWLEKFGYQIVDKSDKNDPILTLIERYKTHLRKTQLNEEIYKWRLIKRFNGRPDTSAPDFTDEIASIDFKNLLYPMAIGVVRHMAKDRPEELKSAFINLFDETKDLKDRVNDFSKDTLKIYRSIDPQGVLNHHQDERSIATYLAFHDSLHYALYKDSFYRKYCNLIGVKYKPKGEKYIHYLSLLDDFINDYVLYDSELLDMKSKLLTDDCFADENQMIFGQDILYTALEGQIGDKNYWRIGTSNGNDHYWETMKANQYVSIGWPDIGNLSESDIQSKNDIIQLLNDNKYYSDNKSVTSRKASEIFNFINDIKEGDIVLAQDGATILGIGKVAGEYGYEESKSFPHYRPVKWIAFNPGLKNSDGLQTTVYKIQQPVTIRGIENLLQSYKNELKMAHDLNQILFGPPGTGKTYNTINKALEICGEDLAGLDRKSIKERFEQKVKEGRIVFTTFHQSMTYEDFVEGIKPIEPQNDGDPVIYRVEEGLFRKLCIEAAFSLAKKEESAVTENVLDFSLAFDGFVQEIEEKLTSEQPVELETKNGGKVIVDGISQQGSILIKHPGKDNIYPVTKQRLSKLHTAFPDLSEVNNIDQEFRSIIGGSNSTVNWSVLNAIRTRNLISSSANKIKREYSWEEKKDVVLALKNNDYKNKDGDAYVLIIDEINRGNVSQIFGELITLIEEDKRLGNAEAIEVQLPYSKASFGVPPNVYIIGTMNTADRSVEALDTALRRRFSFVEIPPKYGLIKTESKAKGGIISGIDLYVLLEVINRRIEKLLDKDHMIGHSYFLCIDTLPSLKTTFRNKIIPLLQEYFYGDYGKIGLILGNGFFEVENGQVDENFFAPFDDYESSSLLERKVYHLRNVADMDDDEFIDAIHTLL